MRHANEFELMSQIELILWMVSSASRIHCSIINTFLEHDDANRAPNGFKHATSSSSVLKAEKPLVGTGLETVVARDSGVYHCC